MEAYDLSDEKKAQDDSLPVIETDSGTSSSSIVFQTPKDDKSAVTGEEGPSPKKLKLDDSQVFLSQQEEDNEESVLLKLRARVNAKEEILSQLQKVEIHKNKWSIEELKNLTAIWKQIAITTFEDLFLKCSTEKESLTKEELLRHLGVDPEELGVNLSN